MLGEDEEIAQEVSCGSGDRLVFGGSTANLKDTVLALQRNQNNFGHFLGEIAPSLLACQAHLPAGESLTIGSPFGASILRLAGFTQPIISLPIPTLARVTDVQILRMLPSGYFNATLLHALAARVERPWRPPQHQPARSSFSAGAEEIGGSC